MLFALSLSKGFLDKIEMDFQLQATRQNYLSSVGSEPLASLELG